LCEVDLYDSSVCNLSPNENSNQPIDNVLFNHVSVISDKCDFSGVVSDDIIFSVAQYVARISLLNTDFATFYPKIVVFSDKNVLVERNDHCCSVCKKHGLEKMTYDFCSQCYYLINYDSISGMELARYIETNTFFIYFFCLVIIFSVNVLQLLRSQMSLRESEVIQTLLLFLSLASSHWQCSSFLLFRNKLNLVFLVCLIIAHKIGADRCCFC
jgi:hypothetical protein